jgi:hypothetical protein
MTPGQNTWPPLGSSVGHARAVPLSAYGQNSLTIDKRREALRFALMTGHDKSPTAQRRDRAEGDVHSSALDQPETTSVAEHKHGYPHRTKARL